MILNKKTHGRPDNHEDIKEMKTVTYIQRYPDNRTPVSDKMAGSAVTTVCVQRVHHDAWYLSTKTNLVIGRVSHETP